VRLIITQQTPGRVCDGDLDRYPTPSNTFNKSNFHLKMCLLLMPALLVSQFSLTSEVQISPTGSSSDIIFTNTEVLGNNVLCATDDGLLLIKANDSLLFSRRDVFKTESFIETSYYSETYPTVAINDDFVYYSTSDSIVHILQVNDQDSLIELSHLNFIYPVKQMVIRDNKLIVSQQIDFGRELYVSVLSLINPLEPEIIFGQDIQMSWGGSLHPSFINDVELYNDTLLVLARHLSDSGNDYAKIFTYVLSDNIEGIPIDTISMYDPDVSFQSMTIKDHYAYVKTTFNTLTVYELSSTNFLDVLNVIDISNAGCLEISENMLVLSSWYRLYIYDLSDPQNPFYLFTVEVDSDGSINDLDFHDGKALVTLKNNGLWKLDLIDGSKSHNVFPNSLAINIYIRNNKSYISGYYGGVVIVDVSQQNNPIIEGTLNTHGKTSDITCISNYLYVCNDWKDLEIFDLGNEDSVIINQFEINSYAKSITVTDNIASVGGYNGFSILDISTPQQPIILGEITNSIRKFLSINDSLIFADAQQWGHIDVFNISSPESPYYLNTILVNDHSNAVCFDNYIYSTNIDSQLVIIDANDPTNPISYTIEDLYFNKLIDAEYFNDTMFISDGNLHSLIVSDPLNPVRLTTYYSEGRTGNIDLVYPFVYTADSGYVRIYRYNSTLKIEEITIIQPNQFINTSCYPNPFNPTTTINYELPQRSDVQITIYDLLGRKVATLLSETQDAGYKTVKWDATDVPSGMYFYQIRVYDPDAVGAGEYVQTRKMVVLK